MTADLHDRLDLQQLVAAGLVARVEHYETITSTHDRAHEVARWADPGPLPLLVVAEQQTAGRGRGSNRWWTGHGSLAFSLLFDPAEGTTASEALPGRSLAIGAAIVDTVAPLAPGHTVGLHWPNDVFVGEKKIAGTLVDVLAGGRHVLGIGLNVNNTLAGAPDEVRRRAVSLCELSGERLDRTALLAALLVNVKAALRDLALDPRAFGCRFQALCLQVGRQLTIEAGDRCTRGRCAGIAPDGALLLESGDGLQRFYSGVLR